MVENAEAVRPHILISRLPGSTACAHVVSSAVVFSCSVRGRIMESSLALVFRARGWKWPHNVLSTVLADLAAEGIKHPDTLFGVELGDVQGTDTWDAEVREFVRHSTQVCSAPV